MPYSAIPSIPLDPSHHQGFGGPGLPAQYAQAGLRMQQQHPDPSQFAYGQQLNPQFAGNFYGANLYAQQAQQPQGRNPGGGGNRNNPSQQRGGQPGAYRAGPGGYPNQQQGGGQRQPGQPGPRGGGGGQNRPRNAGGIGSEAVAMAAMGMDPNMRHSPGIPVLIDPSMQGDMEGRSEDANSQAGASGGEVRFQNFKFRQHPKS